MPAGEVTVRLNLNKDGYSAGMSAARREAQQTVKTISEMGHSTVSTMQASSAAIRVLEGGMTGNIRAAERFISTIPGVGKALQAAFPLVGGIALAGVFVRIGTEAAAAIKKVNEAEQNIANSFRTLNLSGQLANDTLAVTNDRLENEIRKLQGKPENNLALAIDEARVAADKFSESLDRDNSKIKELLSQNEVHWYWGPLTGKAGTDQVSDTVNSQNQQMADLANQANILQHHGDAAGADQLRAQIDSLRQQFLKQNAADIAARRASQGPGALNQGANVSIDLGQQSNLLNQIDEQTELKRNVADQATKAQLEAAKAQQEAAKRAAEALKQAQEAIVAQWRQNLGEQKDDYDLTIAQEGQFWVQRMEAAKKGSLSYIAALSEVNKAIAKMRAENVHSQGEFDKNSPVSLSSQDLSRGDSGAEKEQGRAAADWLRTMNQGIQLQHANADAIAAAGVAMQLQTGKISKLDAAQQLATLHEQQYARAVQAVNDALAAAQSLPDGFDKKQRIAGLNNQLGQVQAAGTLQSAQDKQAVASQQFGPGLQQTFDKMLESWSDMTSQISAAMVQAADQLNNAIVGALQGKKGGWGRAASSIGGSFLKIGLQGAESSLFGGSGFAGLAKLFGGGGSSGVSGVGGGMAGLFQGGFASGGDVIADRPAMVGEQGAEIFVPKTAGRIIPHGKLGGGDTYHSYNVDARGSNDPMAVHAAVARALPHAVAASVQAQHQSTRRRPQSR